INAININDGDQLLDVALTNGDNYIVIAAKKGKAVRFHESDARPMGRTATGVRGIRLDADDKAIGMLCINREDTQLLVVTENGYGKRSDVNEYRITSRGAKGVKAMNVTEKTGGLVAIKEVTDEDDLMIITVNGIAIRMAVADLRVMGRATQGVRLIRLNGKDNIASVTRIAKEEIEEEEDLTEATDITGESGVGESPNTDSTDTPSETEE
ncbi:MAG: DNA gyrase subunit A, partial [Spirosomaceae bacterium]|nr:DNA gyrase subunit A [Spirosomataceae bacterium]